MEVSHEVTIEQVNLLVNRYCENSFKNIKDFQVLKYTVRTLGDCIEGFLGQHFYLEVLLGQPTDAESENTKLKYFVKKAPVNIESFMKYVDEIGVFKKECDLFRQLIPRLQDMNSKFGKFGPECHLVQNNMIIFEDLMDCGFHMGSSRNQLLDYPHLVCALKTLANMHSATVILEDKHHSQLTDLYPAVLKENSFPGWDSDSSRNRAIQNGLRAQCALIKMIPKYRDSPDLQNILGKFRNEFLRLPEFCRTSNRFRNVFLHSDLWSNNLMFKYDGKNNPTDCKIVDFQLSRYAPPLMDVMTLLTATTTKDFRRKHMSVLLENYYHFLDDYLQAHDMDVNDVITKIEFKECASYFRVAGLLMSCHISHETLLPSDMTSHLFSDSEMFKEYMFGDRAGICTKAFENDLAYRERMTDMLTDLVDNYILKECTEYNY